VKSFFVFLAVIVVIGLVWAAKPIVSDRARDQEKMLVASLNLVEEAVVSSSTDILRVDLFSPKKEKLSGEDRWRLSGILETQDRAGKAVFVRYVAAVAFSCTPFGDTGCGKIETLSIEDQPLVIGGAIVAELQTVLSGTTDALGETLPGTNAVPAGLPAPQLETAAPEPAPEPTSAAEPPASEAPPVEEPSVTAAAPAGNPTGNPTSNPTSNPTGDDGPTQGDRQIFLIQKTLKQIGYDIGPVDGQIGPQTTSAIEAYQKQAGLTVDGQPSAALLEHITHAAE